MNTLETIHYTVTIMDQTGNTIVHSRTVTIIDNVDPMASAGPDLIVKQGTKVIMDGSSSTDNIGITNWTWTFDDGSKKISMGGPVIEYKFDKSGTFTLKLTVNDSSGNVGTDTIAVVVERKDSERPSLLIYSVILIALSIIVIVAVSYYVAKRKMFLKKKKMN
jgi:PKD repeat protein